MDKYRPCPSIIAMFTSDSQHSPRSKHAVYLGVEAIFGILGCLTELLEPSNLAGFFTDALGF